MVYESTSVVERLLVENILIGKSITMNLNDGMYKLDNYITNKLIENTKVKRALRECEDFNLVLNWYFICFFTFNYLCMRVEVCKYLCIFVGVHADVYI